MNGIHKAVLVFLLSVGAVIVGPFGCGDGSADDGVDLSTETCAYAGCDKPVKAEFKIEPGDGRAMYFCSLRHGQQYAMSPNALPGVDLSKSKSGRGRRAKPRHDGRPR